MADEQREGPAAGKGNPQPDAVEWQRVAVFRGLYPWEVLQRASQYLADLPGDTEFGQAGPQVGDVESDGNGYMVVVRERSILDLGG